MIRVAAVLAAVLVVAAAVAQQPVQSPIYYLSTAPEVAVGAPVAGELTTASGRNFKDGSYLEVAVLRGSAGQFVDLRAASLEFDTYLTLFAPDGTVVDVNDDDFEGQGTDSAIRASLPMTGTYVVVVSGFGPDDLGAYTLTLEAGREGGAGPLREIALPSSADGVLVAGATDTYVLTVDEATVAGIEVRSLEFDTYLEVQDEFGWTMAENDDMVGTTDSGVVVWLQPGSYRVLVSGYGAWDGGVYTITLERYVRTP